MQHTNRESHQTQQPSYHVSLATTPQRVYRVRLKIPSENLQTTRRPPTHYFLYFSSV